MKVIHCDDNRGWRENIGLRLHHVLPKHEIISVSSAKDVLKSIYGEALEGKDIRSPENAFKILKNEAPRFSDISMVLTDGVLCADDETAFHGWHLAYALRSLDYAGPIAYVGEKRFMNLDSHLYDARFDKFRHDFFSRLMDYVEKGIAKKTVHAEKPINRIYCRARLIEAVPSAVL